MKPIVTYWAGRATAESVRLCLAAAGVDFENENAGDPASEADRAALKANLDAYSFGQVPRYRDEDISMVQSAAIMRYLGRKHGLYGDTPLEAARIDELVDGLTPLKFGIIPVLYGGSTGSEASEEDYWAAHVDPSTATSLNSRGTHFQYIDLFVKKHGQGYSVGERLSIADCLLFDTIEMHQRKFGEERFAEAYPDLAALAKKIRLVPAIAAYLISPLRLPN